MRTRDELVQAAQDRQGRIKFEDGTVRVDFETGEMRVTYHDGSASVALYPDGEALDLLILKLQSLQAWYRRLELVQL